MNLRTTKHRVFVLILLALLAGGLAYAAWGMGPGWPGGAGASGRKYNGAVCHNVSRLRPNGRPVCHPLARSRSDAKWAGCKPWQTKGLCLWVLPGL